ncbi:MAG: hypothetical protein IKL53_01095, partial [Lachnospiraceae bacterium]|nr:hypothetical protein [Lachnospiraceae bacterium]
VNTKANDNVVVNLTTNQTIAGVKTFSAPPVSATNPTTDNQLANKAYVDSVGNAKVALTDNQTIAGNKTLSGATTFNGAITSKGANTFSGNNTFNTGQVTFNNKAPISSVAPTAANHLATKAYVDGINTTLTGTINTKDAANVKLTGNQTVAGNKTLSGTTTLAATVINGATQLKGAVTATGAITSSGNVTFNTGQVTINNKAPICAIAPTADNHLVNRAYSKKRGGYVAVTGGAINLNNGINFSLNLTTSTAITVTNAASNIGQTGEIFIAKGANISGFSAPFNFRIAQSGFGANEVFSYTVVSSSLVRIVRS